MSHKSQSPLNLPRRPLLIVLSGLSGAGKDVVLTRMREIGCPLKYITTVTTRPQRSNEKDNVDYHFVSVEKFQEVIERNELLEWANVYGNWYGVPKGPVKQALTPARRSRTTYKKRRERAKIQAAERVADQSIRPLWKELIELNERLGFLMSGLADALRGTKVPIPSLSGDLGRELQRIISALKYLKDRLDMTDDDIDRMHNELLDEEQKKRERHMFSSLTARPELKLTGKPLTFEELIKVTKAEEELGIRIIVLDRPESAEEENEMVRNFKDPDYVYEEWQAYL